MLAPLCGVACINGAGISVITVQRGSDAAGGRITIIHGTLIAVIASDVIENTVPLCFVAFVDGAGTAIIAFDCCELTPSERVATVVSAWVAIITNNGIRITAFQFVALVDGALVIVVADYSPENTARSR